MPSVLQCLAFWPDEPQARLPSFLLPYFVPPSFVGLIPCSIPCFLPPSLPLFCLPSLLPSFLACLLAKACIKRGVHEFICKYLLPLKPTGYVRKLWFLEHSGCSVGPSTRQWLGTSLAASAHTWLCVSAAPPLEFHHHFWQPPTCPAG